MGSFKPNEIHPQETSLTILVAVQFERKEPRYTTHDSSGLKSWKTVTTCLFCSCTWCHYLHDGILMLSQRLALIFVPKLAETLHAFTDASVAVHLLDLKITPLGYKVI